MLLACYKGCSLCNKIHLHLHICIQANRQLHMLMTQVEVMIQLRFSTPHSNIDTTGLSIQAWQKTVHLTSHFAWGSVACWAGCSHTCITYKKFFWQTKDIYGPCPNPENIKDALCNKFWMLMIGQNCWGHVYKHGGHRVEMQCHW